MRAEGRGILVRSACCGVQGARNQVIELTISVKSFSRMASFKNSRFRADGGSSDLDDVRCFPDANHVAMLAEILQKSE